MPTNGRPAVTDEATMARLIRHTLQAEKSIQYRGKERRSIESVRGVEDEYGVVFVRNDWTDIMKRGEPIGIDEPTGDNPVLTYDAAEQMKSVLIHSGTSPVYPRHALRYGILQDDIYPCEVGRAVVSGVAVANAEYTSTYTAARNLVTARFNEETTPIGIRRAHARYLYPAGDIGADFECAQSFWDLSFYGTQDIRRSQDGTRPLAVGCGATVCNFTCDGGVWKNTSSSNMTAGCDCDVAPMTYYWNFPLPCTPGDTKTHHAAERHRGVLSKVRISNQEFPSPLSYTAEAPYQTCRWTCEDSGNGVYQWLILETGTYLNHCATHGYHCPAVPTEYSCGPTTCPREVTLSCVYIPPNPSSTTSTTTSSRSECGGSCTFLCSDDGGWYHSVLVSTTCGTDCSCPYAENVTYNPAGEWGGGATYQCSAQHCGKTTTTGCRDDTLLGTTSTTTSSSVGSTFTPCDDSGCNRVRLIPPPPAIVSDPNCDHYWTDVLNSNCNTNCCSCVFDPADKPCPTPQSWSTPPGNPYDYLWPGTCVRNTTTTTTSSSTGTTTTTTSSTTNSCDDATCRVVCQETGSGFYEWVTTIECVSPCFACQSTLDLGTCDAINVGQIVTTGCQQTATSTTSSTTSPCTGYCEFTCFYQPGQSAGANHATNYSWGYSGQTCATGDQCTNCPGSDGPSGYCSAATEGATTQTACIYQPPA